MYCTASGGMPPSSIAISHGAGRLLAALFQAHAMIGLAGGSVAADLAVDVGAARPRVLQFLQDEEPGALGDHEAVAIAREGPRGALRLGVPAVLMMRISMKPRRISGAMGASTPPATIMSSTPAWMLRSE